MKNEHSARYQWHTRRTLIDRCAAVTWPSRSIRHPQPTPIQIWHITIFLSHLDHLPFSSFRENATQRVVPATSCSRKNEIPTLYRSDKSSTSGETETVKSTLKPFPRILVVNLLYFVRTITETDPPAASNRSAFYERATRQPSPRTCTIHHTRNHRNLPQNVQIKENSTALTWEYIDIHNVPRDTTKRDSYPSYGFNNPKIITIISTHKSCVQKKTTDNEKYNLKVQRLDVRFSFRPRSGYCRKISQDWSGFNRTTFASR